MGNSKSVEKRNSNHTELFKIGREYQKKGDIKNAEKYYGEAASAGSINAANNLSILLCDQGRYKEGIEILKIAIESQTYPYSNVWGIYCFNLGCLLEITDNRTEAIHFYRQASFVNYDKAVNRLKDMEVETQISFHQNEEPRQAVVDKIWKDIYEDIAVNPKKDDNNLGDEENLCVICIFNTVTHAAIPCGHYNYCLKCIDLKEESKICAICRAPVNSYCKIYK